MDCVELSLKWKVTVQSLQTFYTIVFALALTEAFKSFVRERSRDQSTESPDAHEAAAVYWDALLGLVGLLALVGPFFHGMNLYLRQVYLRPDPPFGIWLLFDVGILTVEGVSIFVLSRNLRPTTWRTFCFVAGVLLLVDALWGFLVGKFHGVPTAKTWAMINVVVGPLLLLCWLGASFSKWECARALVGRFPRVRPVFEQFARYGVWVCCPLLVVRTFFDYSLCWNFYFGAG